jgi:Domain of unknown function (DUF4145)
MDRDMNWRNTGSIEPHGYTCGYCGHGVGPDSGYFANNPGGGHHIYLCSYCRRPTYIEPNGTQFPGVAYGTEVGHLPDGVRRLYNEARNSMSVNAFTAAVMTCRKVLMNVAVSEGAKPSKNFAAYVKWLSDEGYVPAKGKSWVNRIREKGNEANHEIPDINRTDAEDVLSFTEMLLKVNYEMPARAEPTSNDDSPDESAEAP